MEPQDELNPEQEHPEEKHPDKQYPNPALIGDIAGALADEEAEAREIRSTGKAPGPITGIATLDEALGGFLSAGIHPFLAAPGAGKTALALQIAANSGVPTLYVTAEMSRTELLRRIVSRETGTYLGRLRGGELSHEELTRLLANTATRCPMVALYDATLGATPKQIRDRADDLRCRFNTRSVLIVLDSVTDWAACSAYSASSTSNATEHQIAESALSGLQSVSADLKAPIIGIAHRNRQSQNASGGDRLHAAKATGRYEYVAESVWDLNREMSQQPDADGTVRAELTILKNRHGRSGIAIPLTFQGRLQRFWETGY